jgi:hypothetical protein
MRLLRRLTLLALAAFPALAHAACPANVGGIQGPYSNQRLLGTETSDDVLMNGGCIDGYTSYNLLGNGDFFFDQRHEGAVVTIAAGTPTMTLDRWQAVFQPGVSGAGSPTVVRAPLSSSLVISSREALITMSATLPNQIPINLQFEFQQNVEGQELQDIGMGNSGGGAELLTGITFQKWVKASVAGTYYLFIQNAAQTRSYVAPCTMPAATYTLCTLTAPEDGVSGAGQWNTAPGTIGMIAGVTIACGANFQAASINQWLGGNFTCAANQADPLLTGGSTVEVAAAKLVRGGPLSSFEADPIWLADRKLGRFYRKTFPIGVAPAQNAGFAGARCVTAASGAPASLMFDFSPPMYSAPSLITTYNPANSNASWRDATKSLDSAPTVDLPNSLVAKSVNGVVITSAPLTGADVACIHATFDTNL